MPDARHHRGPHPEDVGLFAPAWHAALAQATADLSWLLSRGYASPSAVKVVGDRYTLSARQRTAVMRSACPDAALAARRARELPPEAVRGRALAIDGYNVLTTVEAALAGAVIIVGRDGCWRDMASMHGTWRRVEETVPAIAMVGRKLDDLGVPAATWYLDAPVSNSGRLKAAIEAHAADHQRAWDVRLVPDPDRVIAQDPGVTVSADSVILDRCGPWFSLARQVVQEIQDVWRVDLSTAHE